MFRYLAVLFISLSIVPCLAGAADYAPVKEGDRIPGPDAARAGIPGLAEVIDGRTLAEATLARVLCRGDLLFLSLNEIASAIPDNQQAISLDAEFAAANSHLGIALARHRQ